MAHASYIENTTARDRNNVARRSLRTGMWVFVTLLALALLAWGALQMAEQRTVITPQDAASAEEPALGTGLTETRTDQTP